MLQQTEVRVRETYGTDRSNVGNSEETRIIIKGITGDKEVRLGMFCNCRPELCHGETFFWSEYQREVRQIVIKGSSQLLDCFFLSEDQDVVDSYAGSALFVALG
jgi:hypothetical protein